MSRERRMLHGQPSTFRLEAVAVRRVFLVRESRNG